MCHDPSVLGSSPTSGSLLSREPASPSDSACHSLCLTYFTQHNLFQSHPCCYKSWVFILSAFLNFLFFINIYFYPQGYRSVNHQVYTLHSTHQKKTYSWDAWVAQLVMQLPSAQVMIPGYWDRVPHRAPCSAGSLLLPLPLPAILSACACALYLSLSL